MRTIGFLMWYAGYALAYWGIGNAINGGQGPTISEVFGLKNRITLPGTKRPAAVGNTGAAGQGGLITGTGSGAGGGGGSSW